MRIGNACGADDPDSRKEVQHQHDGKGESPEEPAVRGANVKRFDGGQGRHAQFGERPQSGPLVEYPDSN